MSDARHKVKYGIGLKILTPKSMLQIALAQMKTGNINQKKLLKKYIIT